MQARLLITTLLLIALCSSCKPSQEQMLLGKWQEVVVINPELEETIAKQEAFADSVGRRTDSVQNIRLYGTDNIDTMRAGIKASIKAYRKAQYEAVQTTWFDFKKNGLMYIHSDEGLDSSNWYLDDDGALILDEAKLKGSGPKIRMEIIALSDTGLRLKFTEKFLTSTAVFKPAGKQ